MKQLLTLKINVVVMATYVVMLMIPELLVLEDLHWWVPYLSVPFNLVVYTVLSWFCCTLFALMGRKANVIAHVALHAVVALYVLSNIFLFVFSVAIGMYILCNSFVKQMVARLVSS